MKLEDFTAESETPFIEFVAKNICEADEQEPEDWEAFDGLAVAAIRSIKEWMEAKG